MLKAREVSNKESRLSKFLFPNHTEDVLVAAIKTYEEVG